MRRILLFLIVIFITFCNSSEARIIFLNGKLELGGRVRFRQEIKDGYYVPIGQNKVHDALSLLQTRFYVKFMSQKDLGFYLMFEDARDFTDPHPYKLLTPYAYDTGFDVQQAYLFYEPKNKFISIWAGRREVFYLKHRLIGTTLGWGNKVIAYDGAMVTFKGEKFRFDLSYLNRVSPEHSGKIFQHNWFGQPANTIVAWLTLKKIFKKGDLDIYTIYDDRRNGEDIYALGLRVYGEIKGFIGYDINATLELGDALVGNAFQDRVAGAFYLDTWCNLNMRLKPTIGLEYFMATGDNYPQGGNYNTFDQLYATPHYSYGYMDLIGWQNMHDLNFKAWIKPVKGLKCGASFHTFWLFANEDNWYNAYKKVQRYGKKNASHYIGNELDFIFFYNFTRYLTFIGTYAHFFAGKFVAQTGQSNDADFFSMEVRFGF
ncbi:MAG TPA: hypothetical protein ENF30_02355 [Candidatus Desulfofervidus auxilii]|uniref:Alginate export domain-containing protein n=1 Tax=Desulfofervidus auxilii TaxID=1621989 RepID=A0A7V0IAB4_DESA2|nr:hypothetical protein [Candidatus Desulfofervidus auxilii]